MSSIRPPIWKRVGSVFNFAKQKSQVDNLYANARGHLPKAKKEQERSKIAAAFMISIPIITFSLGTWQVKRLKWKEELIENFSSRIDVPPMLLPEDIENRDIASIRFYRVLIKGKFRHDQEILLGPRQLDGKPGYHVITPLELDRKPYKVLINRGWIPKSKAEQKSRPDSVTDEEIILMCTIAPKMKKNWLNLSNRADKNEFHTLDTEEFADLTSSAPVLLDALQDESIPISTLIDNGLPLGKEKKFTLSNNHREYIITWYGISILTAIMTVFLFKKRSTKAATQVSERLKAAQANSNYWR